MEQRRNLTCVEAHCTGALDFSEKKKLPYGIWKLKSRWVYGYIERQRTLRALEYTCSNRQASQELHEQLAGLLLPDDIGNIKGGAIDRFNAGATVNSFNTAELTEIHKAYIERVKRLCQTIQSKNK